MPCLNLAGAATAIWRTFLPAARVSIFTALIMGPPGSGKGTVSKKLQQQYNFYHISSGDALRDHVRRSTALGLQVKENLRRGEFVPDDVMLKLIVEEIEKTPEDKSRVLLDGFPRTVAQAEALEALMNINLSIVLDVPTEEIVERAKGRLIHEPSGRSYCSSYDPPKHEGIDDVTGEPLVRRPDDAPEVVAKRLELYWNSAEPLTAFYAQKDKLLRANGETHPALIKQDRRSDAIMDELAVKFNTMLDPQHYGAQQVGFKDDVNSHEALSQAKA
eukprot:GEMP01031600.1.p1 GENE.GEMP01031600.1~~GEMP01031600.1.p1  ORF type:complete len:274 (+),score=70.50 GEMP01031600.1:97-918(+)